MKTLVQKSGKDGAALVIALGFLALLTIAIVAFSVQMRAERLAGRDFLASAQTRQLLQTALSRALEDVDAEASGTNYPAFFAFGSLDSTGGYLADSLDFSVETAYLLGRNSPIHAAFLQVLDNEARWQVIDGTNNRPLGRVGYIVLNTSGLLDANTIGQFPRRQGDSPGEIMPDSALLPELNASSGPFVLHARVATSETTTNSARAFARNRDQAWNRFESLRDVKTLNQLDSSSIIVAQPESFCTFSRFPSTPSQRLELTVPMDHDPFANALSHCDLDELEIEAVIAAYADYVDDDDIPSTLLGSCVEAVPMINEIWVGSLEFRQDPQDTTNINYSLSGDLYVETWYPFDDTYPETPTLELRAGESDLELDEIVENPNAIGDAGFITLTALYPGDVGKTFVLSLELDDQETVVSGNFKTTRYTFQFAALITLAEPFSEEVPDPESIHLLEESLEVVLDEPVDRVEKVVLEFDYNSSSGFLDSQQASCVDPRINHNFQDPTQWEIGVQTSPNTVNHISDWGEQSDLVDKPNIRFYVRNGPMRSAAELGLLSTGIPWRTVRLYGGTQATLHPVLDYFRASGAFWDAATHPGLINLDSPYTNILATAFRGAPIQNTPADVEFSETVSSELARKLGSNLAAAPPNHQLSSVGLAVSNNIPGWILYTDAQKDAIVANTYKLFGWRDTHYTILLAAQTLAGDEVQASQQAIVHVWRDPVSGKCACVFYGLTDTLRSTIDGDRHGWGAILQAFKP